ncbi:MAG: oligosaccharide flippase family protein [Bacteroidetes bacterium]|nr:oligosaccharide flippase family protein [Bacteroidota bacterium]
MFKNSFWVLFSNSFGAGMTFIRSIVIARGLGAELYGIFAVMTAFIVTIQAILNLNLGAVVIRFGSKYKTYGEINKLVSLIKVCTFASAVAASLVVVVIGVLILFSYDSFIKTPGLGWYALFFAVGNSGTYFANVSRGALRLYYKFKANAKAQMLMDVAEVVLIILALFFYPKNMYVFLVAVIISKLVFTMVPVINAYKELYPELRDHIGSPMRLIQSEFKSIWQFTFKNSISQTMQSLINMGDVLLIGLWVGNPTQAGFYNVGKKMAFAILTITGPLANSIYPQLCLLYADKQIAAIKKMIIKLSVLASIPATLFMLVAFFFNQIIMTTVFGSEYLEAGEPFYILTAAALISAVFFWIHPLLQALDLLAFRIRIYGIAIITGLVVAWFLVPKIGSSGMAVALIFINVIIPLFSTYYIFKKLRISESEINHPV